MGNDLTRVESSGVINLDGLELSTEPIAAMFTKSMEHLFEEYPPWIAFDSDRNADPGTLLLCLPALGMLEVFYSCSLEGVVDDMVEDPDTNEVDKDIDDHTREQRRRLAIHLRQLADKIDASV